MIYSHSNIGGGGVSVVCLLCVGICIHEELLMVVRRLRSEVSLGQPVDSVLAKEIELGVGGVVVWDVAVPMVTPICAPAVSYDKSDHEGEYKEIGRGR
jgi:hypothetical protein